MLKITHILFLITFFVINSFATQKIVLDSKSATALNTVTLYPDSTFLKHSNVFFEKGSLFELIGESVNEHEDDAQNQKFKWYQVKTNTGKTGWIYGDGLAVIVPDYAVSKTLQNIHKKKINLDKGFEKALMWVAAVEGRDNFHAKDYLNPIYNEYYLVITNRFGKSMHINISGVNARGKNELTNIELLDITGDFIPEIIVETLSSSNESDLKNQNLNIFSSQGGTLVKLFDERLTLAYEDDLQSPALRKRIEIDKDMIRVEYVDYINCTNYQQQTSVQTISKTMERCMEYVTYSYKWNTRKKAYEILYEETRTSLAATVKYPSSLKEHPATTAKSLASVQRQEAITVIKHFEKVVVNSGHKKIETYLLVQTATGSIGYLPADYVQFQPYFHADILHTFYQQAPLSKNDWHYNKAFVSIDGLKVAEVR